MFTKEDIKLSEKIMKSCQEFVKNESNGDDEVLATVHTFNTLYLAKIENENKRLTEIVQNLTNEVVYLRNSSDKGEK